jgi:ribosome biogenesis GTPase A
MLLPKLVLLGPLHLENKETERNRLVQIMQVIEMTLNKTREKLCHLLEEKPLVVKKVDLVDLFT